MIYGVFKKRGIFIDYVRLFGTFFGKMRPVKAVFFQFSTLP